MDSGIYTITNTVTNRIYGGQSTRVTRRLKEHRWALERGTHPNPHLQQSWYKYGPDVFEFEMLDDYPAFILDAAEQTMLDILFTLHDEGTYNMLTTVNEPPSGPKSWAHRVALSEANRGRKLTPDELTAWQAYPDLSLSKALEKSKATSRRQPTEEELLAREERKRATKRAANRRKQEREREKRQRLQERIKQELLSSRKR